MPTLVFVALFFICYLLTFNRFLDHAYSYFALTATACLLAVTLARFVLQGFKRLLPLWVIFAVFICCYYLKFYAIVIWPDLMIYVPMPMAYNPAAAAPANLMRVYELTTLGFCGFFVAAVAVHYFDRAIIDSARVAPSREAACAAVFLGVALSVLTNIVMLRYGMTMGSPVRTTLPFHLRGVVLLSRKTLIPMLMLLGVQYAFQSRDRLLGAIGGLLAILYGVSNVVFLGSKAGIAHILLQIAFLPFLLGYRIRPVRAALVGALAVLSVAAAYPLAGAFREAHAVGLGLSDSLKLANSVGIDSESLARMLVMRLTGVDAFTVVVDAEPKPVGMKFWGIAQSYPNGFGGYVNEEVLGVPSDLSESGIWAVAPSLLGTLYVLDGRTGVFVGTALFTLLVSFLWLWLRDKSLLSGPVVQTVFLEVVVLGTATDGALGLELRSELPFFLISVALLEVVARVGFAQKLWKASEV